MIFKWNVSRNSSFQYKLENKSGLKHAGVSQLTGTDFSLLLLFSIASFIPLSNSFADSTPLPTINPATVSLSDYDAICNNSASPAPSSGSEGINQKQSLCDSAKGSMDAASLNEKLWPLWAAVAGLCASTCAGYPIPGIPSGCIASAVGAAVIDGVATKNLAGSLMGLMGIGTAAMMSNRSNEESALNSSTEAGSTTSSGTSSTTSGANTGSTSTSGSSTSSTTAKATDAASGTKATKERKSDLGACVATATAVMQAYTKYSAVKSSKDTALENLKSAASLNTGASSLAVNLVSGAGGNTTGLGGQTSSTGSGSNSGSGTPTSTSSNLPPGCNFGYSNGVASGIQCALATDSNLPPWVGSPRFPDQFKKTTGVGLDDFLTKSTHPTQALGVALGNSVGMGNASGLSTALQKVEQQLEIPTIGSSYSGGGGSNNGGGDGQSDSGLGSVMANLMNQMNPQGKSSDKPSGYGLVVFANANRPAHTIPDDKTLNIFDRITFRYFALSGRILDGGR